MSELQIGERLVDVRLARPDDILKVDRDSNIIKAQRLFSARQGDWVLDHISPTQLNQFLDCPRKWFFRYMLGHRYPATEPMLYGTAVHADLEGYYRGEKPQPVTAEAAYIHARGLLPPKEHVLQVELSLEDLQIRLGDPAKGPPMLGFVDMTWIYDTAQQLQNWDVRVWDWKVRSGFGYAPNSEDLARDFQAILYPLALFVLFERRGVYLESVKFAHMNLLREDKGGPLHKFVETTMTRKMVEDALVHRINPLVHEMNNYAKKKLSLVKPHKRMCFKYGKACEHMDNCKRVHYSNAPTTGMTSRWKLQDLLMPQLNGEHPMTTLNDLITPQFAQQPQPANGQTAPAHFPAPGVPQAPMPVAPQAPMPVAPQAPMPVAPQAQQPTLPIAPQAPAQQAQHQGGYVQPQVVPQPQQPQQAAPRILPVDVAPDPQPVDVNDMTIEAFPWTKAQGIGDKGREKILAYLREHNFTHMSQLLQGFDFKSLPGVGEAGAQAIRLEISNHEVFNPNANAQAQNEAGLPSNPAGGLPNAPLHGLPPEDQKGIMHAAAEMWLNGQIPDLTHLTPENREVFAHWREASKDYAPPPPVQQQAPPVVQQQQAPPVVQQQQQQQQQAPPVVQQPDNLYAGVVSYFDQTGHIPDVSHLSDEQKQHFYAYVKQVRQTRYDLQAKNEREAQRNAADAAAAVTPGRPPEPANVRSVKVNRFVQRGDFNNASVEFTIEVMEGDDLPEVTKRALAFAEYLALGGE